MTEKISTPKPELFDFSRALTLLQRSKAVARESWQGAMAVSLRFGSHDFTNGPMAAGEYISSVNSQLFESGHTGTVTRMPSLEAYNGSFWSSWNPSNADLLAQDWVAV